MWVSSSVSSLFLPHHKNVIACTDKDKGDQGQGCRKLHKATRWRRRVNSNQCCKGIRNLAVIEFIGVPDFSVKGVVPRCCPACDADGVTCGGFPSGRDIPKVRKRVRA